MAPALGELKWELLDVQLHLPKVGLKEFDDILVVLTIKGVLTIKDVLTVTANGRHAGVEKTSPRAEEASTMKCTVCFSLCPPVTEAAGFCDNTTSCLPPKTSIVFKRKITEQINHQSIDPNAKWNFNYSNKICQI